MNKLTMIGGSGVLGLCLGLVMGGNGVNGQSLALAGLLALPPVAVGLVVADTKAQSKINQAESKASKALRTLDDVTLKLATSEQTEARLKLELVEVLQQLGRVREVLKNCESERCQSVEITNRLQSSLKLAAAKVEELSAEVEAWEGEFHSRIEVEAEKRFQVAKQVEIQRIQAENDEITNEALDIVRGFRQWAVEVDGRLQDRGEFIKSVTTQYNSHLEGLKGSVSTQIEEYLKQIEILNCKVAALQQKLAGDLVETELLEVAYSVEGRIANDIAKEVFATLQIPLAVRGYHVKPDGSTDAAYGYSRSMGSVALIEALKKQSEAIAKSLRIHKITSVRKLEIADLIVVSFRREPSVKDDTIKLIAGTPEQFSEYVASHPIRYRLIADPGAGKTPITAVMVSELLKVGGTRGNTGKGRKIPNTLVTVSCPDVESSQKDADYPLEIFLKYGNSTAAVKSFTDADEDWQYRKRDTNYANDFFLDDLEPYIEDKNSLVTDAARLLRLALVLDDKSPKLYFLPNLDSAKFNVEKIEETTNKAQLVKRSFLAGTAGNRLASNGVNPDSVSTDQKLTVPSNPTIGGDSQSSQKPHCPHCGSDELNLLNDGRYRCLDCKKRFVTSKIVWK